MDGLFNVVNQVSTDRDVNQLAISPVTTGMAIEMMSFTIGRIKLYGIKMLPALLPQVINIFLAA